MSKDRLELRDSEEARRFVLQGLWCQRVLPPRSASVRSVLEWVFEIASSGLELPPTGFLADLGHLALGQDRDVADGAFPAPPGVPLPLLRTYEDYVLGKLYADGGFSRAGDALRRYQGRDRARGLAFLYRRFAERSGFKGLSLSPRILKSALDAPPEQLLAQGWESLGEEGPQAELLLQYEALIAAAQRTADVLGPEDASQLERGTALRPEGEQLAELQVLRAAQLLESALPRHRPRPRPGRQEVPTRILVEDTYPVGGFSSLSTRGSIESLLHSQLAYIEDEDRPDLFDIKFLRDELLYYARDENQFLRLRHSFVFVLYPDLEQTRFKDRELDYQRGVLLLALLYLLVRKLIEWLTSDALTLHFVFVVEGEKDTLQPERALLASLFADEIGGGIVRVQTEKEDRLTALCQEWARHSLCHVLAMDVRQREWTANDVRVGQLWIDGPAPTLADWEPTEGEDARESWSAVLRELLMRWT